MRVVDAPGARAFLLSERDIEYPAMFAGMEKPFEAPSPVACTPPGAVEQLALGDEGLDAVDGQGVSPTGRLTVVEPGAVAAGVVSAPHAASALDGFEPELGQ